MQLDNFLIHDRTPRADRHLIEAILAVLKDGIWDENPRPRWADGTPAHTRFISHVVQTYDLAAGEFPLISLRNMAWKSAVKEMLWIYQDQTSDLSVLEDKYNIYWWRDWESTDRPGTIGQRYGATVRKYDLLNRLLRGLAEDPYGRRHIMSLWQEEDFRETDGLVPCAFQTLWTVRGEELDMVLVQRSSDYLTAGHINQLQYAALLMMVAQVIGRRPGRFTHLLVNLHIYDRHLDNAQRLLERYRDFNYTGLQPRLILNPEVKNFYDFTIADFDTENWERFKEPADQPMKFEVAI